MKTRYDFAALCAGLLLCLPADAAPTTEQASVKLDLAKDSDTGRSSSDGVTAQASPVLSGIAPVGAELVIAEGSRVLAKWVVSRSSGWTRRIGPLSDGTHTLVARSGDEASRPLTVVIDTTPPPIPTLRLDPKSDTGPSRSDGITSDTFPVFHVHAPGDAVAVEIHDGMHDRVIPIAAGSPDWRTVLTTKQNVRLAVRALSVDLAGNRSEAGPPVTLHVIKNPPKAPEVELDPRSDDGPSKDDGVTSVRTPRIFGQESLPGEIRVFDKGKTIATTATKRLGRWSVTLPPLRPGLHKITVAVADRAGNTSPRSDTIELVVTGGVPQFSVRSLTERTGFHVVGAQANSVSPVGDINGDGFGDFAIAITNAFFAASPSPAYVVFGSEHGLSDGVDLGRLNGTNGFVITSPLGRLTQPTSAGDVNGDGIDDLAALLVAPANAPEGLTQRAIVLFGHPGAFPDAVDVTSLDGGNGFAVAAQSVDAPFGVPSAVAGAGDFDKDGIEDLAVGIPNENIVTESGDTYVIPGRRSSFPAEIPAGTLPGSDAIRLTGFPGFGAVLAPAGDINGDGVDDLAIGLPSGRADSARDGGIVVLAFGKAGLRGTVSLAHPRGGDGLRVDAALPYGASRGWARFGESLAGGHDINGDGLDDVVVGGCNFATAAVVILGGRKLPPRMWIDRFGGRQGFRIETPDNLDACSSVAVADVDGDGLAEVLVGERPLKTGKVAGVVGVVRGRKGPFPEQVELVTMPGKTGFTIVGREAGDRFGASVASAGDVNGDGFEDVIVGAPDEQSGGAYVLFGSKRGLLAK